MKLHETCLCTKFTVDFASEFDGDVVTKLYCPTCVSRAPETALVFELCEPGMYQGVWAVDYNRGELKRLDPHFRDTDDYYISLLASNTCGPTIARDYKRGGLCRIFGMKEGPDERHRLRTLNSADAAPYQE